MYIGSGASPFDGYTVYSTAAVHVGGSGTLPLANGDVDETARVQRCATAEDLGHPAVGRAVDRSTWSRHRARDRATTEAAGRGRQTRSAMDRSG